MACTTASTRTRLPEICLVTGFAGLSAGRLANIDRLYVTVAGQCFHGAIASRCGVHATPCAVAAWAVRVRRGVNCRCLFATAPLRSSFASDA